MRRVVFSLVFVMTSCLSPYTHAQSLDDVKDLLDEDAFLVMGADLNEIDVEALIRTFDLGLDPRATAEAKAVFSRLVERLTKAGVTRVYTAMSMRDIDSGPHVLLVYDEPPTSIEDTVATLRGLFGGPQRQQPVGHIVGRLAYFGGQRTFDRLKEGLSTASPSRLEKMNAAWKAAGDATLRVAFVPSEDTRAVFRQLAPPLPKSFGKYDIRDVLDGAQWAVLGVEPKNSPSLRLTIQSKDDAAAANMTHIVAAGVEVFVQQAIRVLGRDAIAGLADAKKIITPKQDGDRLVAEITPEQIKGIRRVMLEPLRQQAFQTREINQLKQIALAMLNFESAYGAYPPHASYSKSGKPLLSWRVYVLPYLEENKLYKKFRLDEPWDSEHNHALIKEIPEVYVSRTASVEHGKTPFLVPVGESTVFFGKNGTRLRDIKDGTSRTFLCVRTSPEYAVEWTKPSDWEVDLADPFEGLVGRVSRFLASRCDGSVTAMEKQDLKPSELKALVTKAGGEIGQRR